MGQSNAYELPSESVTIYLDRYTAQRLLLALTQALEPGGGKKYYKKSKKGKDWNQTGMKLNKKGYSAMSGLKLTKAAEEYSPTRVVIKAAAPKAATQGATTSAAKSTTKASAKRKGRRG